MSHDFESLHAFDGGTAGDSGATGMDDSAERPAGDSAGPGARRRRATVQPVAVPPPRVRRGTLRVPFEAAFRLRGGHPWVFRDTLGSRPAHFSAGEIIDVFDTEGGFVGRGIYDTEGPIAVRMLSRDSDETIDGAAFARRVRAAAQLRSLVLKTGEGEGSPTAYRVIHGEGDFLPGITVDKYADYLVIHLYSASLEPHLPVLLDALTESYHPRGVYLQRRFRPLGGEGPRDGAELVRGVAAPPEVEVQEGGLRFGVDVTSPLSTGLFLDLRLGRQAVAARSRGRKVLNLFSYTGALSMYAAAGGASEVVSVDLSARAHARGRRNLTLSGLSEAGHEFITGDVMAVMTRMEERRRHFDMVIIDPPAFAHPSSSSQGRDRDKGFSVTRDYRELVRASLVLCKPGAFILCVANAAKFALDDLMNAIGDGAGKAKRFVRIIDHLGLPPDFPISAGFPEGYYLKVLLGAVI